MSLYEKQPEKLQSNLSLTGTYANVFSVSFPLDRNLKQGPTLLMRVFNDETKSEVIKKIELTPKVNAEVMEQLRDTLLSTLYPYLEAQGELPFADLVSLEDTLCQDDLTILDTEAMDRANSLINQRNESILNASTEEEKRRAVLVYKENLLALTNEKEALKQEILSKYRAEVAQRNEETLHTIYNAVGVKAP